MHNQNVFFNLIDRLLSLPKRRLIMSLYFCWLAIYEECINNPKEWFLGLIGRISSLQKRRTIMFLCLHKMSLYERFNYLPKILLLIILTTPIILLYKINKTANTEHAFYIKQMLNQHKTANKTEAKAYWKNIQITSNASISKLLTQLGVNKENINSFIQSNLLENKPINPEGSISAKISTNGNLYGIQFLNDKGNGEHDLIAMQKINNKWSNDVNQHKEQDIPNHHLINIKSSANEALRLAGVPLDICTQLEDIFSEKIKLSKLVAGDTIYLAYKIHTYNGNIISSDNILSAKINHKNKKYTAYFFKYDGSNGAYYDDTGKPLKHGFEQEPVAGAHINSYFGIQINPILHSIKIHDGIDYAASEGTPVIAPSNGVIKDLQQTDNGYGNMIKISNSKSIDTIYANLSAFKHNLHIGQKIKTGELIGYVGSSGISNGTQLHFEVRKDGFAINPATSVLPTHILSKNELAAFKIKKALFLAEQSVINTAAQTTTKNK